MKQDLIDFHLHSHYSDGYLSPKELAKKAAILGLKVLSLTDHQTVKGIEEMNFWGKKYGIKNIPGVEIYTHFKGKHLHLLGYNFDWRNKKLNRVLEKLQTDRWPQIRKAINLLNQEKWLLKIEDILAKPTIYPDMSHLANCLKQYPKNWKRIKKDFHLRPGQILTLSEIIVRYFFKNGRSICPFEEILTSQAIKLIHQAGGKAVLAHPSQQLHWSDDQIIWQIKKMGLDGLEAISGHHSWLQVEHYQKLAKEMKLFITAGSDYHGDLPEEWGFSARSQWDYFGARNNLIKSFN